MGRSDNPLILVVDLGSSSVRGLLFDGRGREVPGSDARLGLELSRPGGQDPDPEAVLRQVLACLDQAVDRAGVEAHRIAGVGLCTFVSNVLGLDRDGRPCTGLLTYADTRAAPQAEELKRMTDEQAAHQRTGCRFHPSYLTAQLLHLAQTSPEVFRRTARWASLGEYLELNLFGEARVSLSTASWTGLLDRRRLTWDRPLLELVGVAEDQLSPLAGSGQSQQGLKPEFARRWPALARVPWFPAVGDGAAANVGSGCLGPDRAALTMGTSTALRMATDKPLEKIPEGLFCYRIDEKTSLLGGALTEGGGLYQWVLNNLNLGDLDRAEQLLMKMKPDSHGLTVLPFWSGERSPGWQGQVKGTVEGLTLATGPLEILRAMMEAVALRIAAVHRLLEPSLAPDHEMVVSGAALRNSPVWRGIVADALGRRLVVPQIQEASARGAALLVLEALGIGPGPRAVDTPLEYTQEPDLERHRIYCRAGERQADLYGRVLGA